MRRIRTLVVAVLLAGSAYGVVRGSMTDVLTGTWTPAGLFTDARTGGAAVSLPDGRTLIAGGNTAEGAPTDAVVVYDPIAASFTTVGHLVSVRVGHTATLLDDGRVLVVGGTTDGLVNADLELFDSSSGMSSLVAVMGQPRSGHAAARLADGTVLIVGGSTTDGVVLQSAEIFDPTTNGLTLLTSGLVQKRTGASATTLIDGRVLVAGGNNGTADLGSGEIYYPLAQTFSPVPTQLSVARAGHVALLLPHNNGVLIAGGTSAGQAVTTADLFLPAIFPDPFSYGVGEFVATGAMAAARSRAIGGAAGGDGLAFVAGGGVADAEHYHFATIKTDQDDYAPGDRAVITGTGWQPGEEVTLLFQEDPAVHDDYVLTLTADSQGNVYWDQWAPEEHDLGVRFYLTATDSISRAQTTFTDANNFNVSPANLSIGAGSTYNFSWTFTATNNGNEATSTFTIPSTWTAPQNVPGPGQVTVTGCTSGFTIGGPASRVITITQSGTGGGGRCGSGQTLTIGYSNVTVPTPAATPQAYSFVFDDGPDPTVTVTAPPAVSVAVSPPSMAEDAAGNLTYTFTRAGVAGSETGSITVNFSVGGTATFITDYTQTGATTFTSSNGTVTFSPGSATATVSIDPTSDISGEPDETVVLAVVTGAGYTVGSQNSATGTITNDDAATLKVKKIVVNNYGGTAVANDWTLAVTSTDGGTGTGSAPGSTSGTDYTLQVGKTYNVTESGGPSGYADSKSADCTNLVPVAGGSYECTITNNDIQPKLTVIKTVINDNGGTATAANFTMTVTGNTPSPGSFAGAEAPGTEVLLNAGTYNVAESGPFGYASTKSADCSGSIGVGETKTCTVTNNDIQPKLTVIKTVINDNGGTAAAANFTMTVTGNTPSPGSFAGAEAPGTEVLLNAGTYNVAESGPFGYASTKSADCSGSIGVGETKTCTVTNNDIQPKLTVIKTVINDNGGTAAAANFTMTVTGNTPSPGSFAGAEAPGTEVLLNAGTYNVAESGPFGYASTKSADCSGSIGIGETKACTVTNDDIQPKLTVIKTVINDNGGTATAANFAMTVTGNNPSPSSFAGAEAPGTEVLLNAGTYGVNESGPAGYARSDSADCSGSIGVGETKTCTVTNNDIQPKLTVIKTVINDNGGTATAANFTMTVTGSTPSPGSFAGAEAPGTEVLLNAGTYSVNESGPAGYARSDSADCSGSIGVGETKTCTVTNNDIQPKLTVIKTVINDNGGTATAVNFTMTVTGNNPSPGSFAGAEAPGTEVGLDVGTYNVAESGPFGYASTKSADCSGSIGIGETKTCTVTNDDIQPKLTVIKTVINDNGGTATAANFTMTVTGNTPSPGSFAGAEAPGTEVLLNAGTYNVAESGPFGYASTKSADCSGSIGIGETKACTVTNDDIQPKLTVIKTVINDNGGTATAVNFAMTVTGNNPSPSSFAGAESPGTEVGLDAGSYSVNESGLAGYARSDSADCSGSIAIGEAKTCTITNNDIQPKLFVIKTVINDHGGAAAAADFTMSVNGADVTLPSFPGAGAPGTEIGLDAGTYSVSETGPSGYARSDSADCSGSIAIGQTKTCTIINNDIQPKLYVIKAVVNDHGGTATAANFTMSVNGTDVSLASFAGTGAPGTEVGLDAGTFSVGESGPAGYARSDSADCSGTIAVGETKTCTVTNDDIQPKLTVIKTMINDHGGTAASSDFTMTVTGTDVSPGSFPGSASGTTVGLDAGAYTVTESVLFGYAQSSSIDCSGTIAIGETKTCTVTNDDIQPKLTVIKTVINDNGGTAVASNFTMSVSGIEVSLPSFPGAPGPGGTLVGLDAGSYTVGETPVFGYAPSATADCAGSINIGETKTCTITNNDIQPQLIVIKHVVNNNGGVSVASSFTMSVTGNNVSPASFPGAESPGTTVALNAGSFSVGETGPPLYIRSDSGECSGTIGIGEVKTCTVTNNDLYDFRGFFSPVENLPKVNKVNAGRAIPLKWELRDHLGNFVLNLDAVDSIQYVRVGCSVGEVIAPMPLDADDSGTSGLRITDNQFHFNWKTEKSFANTCMELRVTLDDSTVHVAKFNFTK